MTKKEDDKKSKMTKKRSWRKGGKGYFFQIKEIDKQPNPDTLTKPNLDGYHHSID